MFTLRGHKEIRELIYYVFLIIVHKWLYDNLKSSKTERILKEAVISEFVTGLGSYIFFHVLIKTTIDFAQILDLCIIWFNNMILNEN